MNSEFQYVQPTAVSPADRHLGSLLYESASKRCSQPVRSASDEDDLAVQMQIHRAIVAWPR